MLEPSTAFEKDPFDWQTFAKLYFSDAHPAHAQLNMNVEDISTLGVTVSAILGDCFKADNSAKHVERGVLTLLLDSVFGLALFAHTKELGPIATITLKTEYLLPADVGGEISCTASCFALEGNIARMQGEVSDPVTGVIFATATAAFMTGTAGPSFSELEKP